MGSSEGNWKIPKVTSLSGIWVSTQCLNIKKYSFQSFKEWLSFFEIGNCLRQIIISWKTRNSYQPMSPLPSSASVPVWAMWAKPLRIHSKLFWRSCFSFNVYLLWSLINVLLPSVRQKYGFIHLIPQNGSEHPWICWS